MGLQLGELYTCYYIITWFLSCMQAAYMTSQAVLMVSTGLKSYYIGIFSTRIHGRMSLSPPAGPHIEYIGGCSRA